MVLPASQYKKYAPESNYRPANGNFDACSWLETGALGDYLLTMSQPDGAATAVAPPTVAVAPAK